MSKPKSIDRRARECVEMIASTAKAFELRFAPMLRLEATACVRLALRRALQAKRRRSHQ